MGSVWLQVGLVLLLVVANAAFAGSEVAVISLREGGCSAWSRRAGVAGWLPGWPATPTSFCPPSRSASPWPGSWPRQRPR